MNSRELKKAMDEQAKNKEGVVFSVVDSQEREMREEKEEAEITNENLVMIKEVVATLVDVDKIDIKTDFKRNEIILFQQVEILADLFNIPVLKEFCLGIKMKKLSIDRGLRKELVQAIMQMPNVSSGLDMGDSSFPFSMGKNMRG